MKEIWKDIPSYEGKYQASNLGRIRSVERKVRGICHFTNKEFEIIELLMKKNGEVVSREELFNRIWGNDVLESRTIDMHIKALRQKINDADGSIIKSVYGIGYKIEL